MIVIQYGDVHCKLVKGRCKQISPALKFKDPNAKFTPQYRAGTWDGYHRFLDFRTREFPTGFLSRVEKRCKRKNLPYRIIRPERKPVSLKGVDEKMLFGKNLYADQVPAVKIGLSAERGFFSLATNWGKSVLISALSLHLHNEVNAKGLVLVPNKGLLHQTAKDVAENTGLRVGIIGDGKREIGEITVATPQTLMYASKGYVADATARAMERARKFRKVKVRVPKWDRALWKFLQRVNLILVDEGHHASADTWRYILGECPARFRFGMTGSFRDNDNPVKMHTLEAYLGPLLMDVRNDQLIRTGRSARVFVRLIRDPDIFRTKCKAPKYKKYKKRDPITGKLVKKKKLLQPHEKYKHESDKLLGDKRYNTAVAKLAKACADGKLKPLILTQYIKHLHELEKLLKEQGLNPYSIWGNVAAPTRESHKAAYADDPKGVILGSTVFDEGQNVPTVGALILAGGGKAHRRTLQRIGRALRKKAHGLNAVLVLDMFADNGEYLAKHSEARRGVYKEEKFPIVAVSSLSHFCDKVVQGWPGILGRELYDKLLQEQKSLSAKV